LLLVLAAIAYAVVPLVDKLTLRWFVRDLEIRAELITNTMQDTLQEQVLRGTRAKTLTYFNKILQDERLFAVGFCAEPTRPPVATAMFPAAIRCDDLERFDDSDKRLFRAEQGPLHVVVRTIEHLPDAPPDDRELPDAIVMVADTLLVLDNLFNRATVIATVEVGGEAERRRGAEAQGGGEGVGDVALRRLYQEAEGRIDRWLERLAAPSTMGPLEMVSAPALPAPATPYSDARFKADVARIKEYIAAGDTFQTVLSRRLDLEVFVSPETGSTLT